MFWTKKFSTTCFIFISTFKVEKLILVHWLISVDVLETFEKRRFLKKSKEAFRWSPLKPLPALVNVFLPQNKNLRFTKVSRTSPLFNQCTSISFPSWKCGNKDETCRWKLFCFKTRNKWRKVSNPKDLNNRFTNLSLCYKKDSVKGPSFLHFYPCFFEKLFTFCHERLTLVLERFFVFCTQDFHPLVVFFNLWTS